MVEKKYIAPNAITAANILLGYLSIISSIKGEILYAIWFIFLAMICDGLDGKAARKLDAFSEFGKEFDSFADATSFGIAPSILVYSILAAPTNFSTHITQLEASKFAAFVIPVAFVYALCGIMRLVKFNVVTVASYEMDDFSGMPIPNGAATVISYLLICKTLEGHFDYQFFNIEVFMGITIISAVLMVSTITFLTPDKVFKFPKKFMPVFIIVVLATLKYSMFIVSFYYIIYNLIQFRMHRKELKKQ